MVVSRWKYKLSWIGMCLGLLIIFKLSTDTNIVAKDGRRLLQFEDTQVRTEIQDLLYCQEKRLEHLKMRCLERGINSNLSSYDYSALRNAIRLYIVDDPHKVILRAIPKTGISSWKTIFINNSVNRVDKTGGIKQWDWGLLKTKYGLKVLSDYRNLESMVTKLNDYFNILTVRHPLDRLESAFWDRIWRKRHRQNMTDLSEAAKGFAQFVKTLNTQSSDGHFKPIHRSTIPCAIPFSFITKLETADPEMRYIVDNKLSGRGGPVRRNAYNARTSSTSQSTELGKTLPLFSKLTDPQATIDTLMAIYGTDMDLFGYTYNIKDGKVVALCQDYNQHNMCC